ncbi:MAG: CoA transferase, partial [Caulobacteraceae bacterium]
REAIVTVDHPVFGPIRMQSVFPKLSGTPGAIRWPGPRLGEHTAEILRDLVGADESRLAALSAAGVI